MPRTKGKKKAGEPPAASAPELSGLDLQRAGMPAPDSIIGVERMERGGKVYRIIKTDEVDAYEEPPQRKRRRGAKKGSRQ
jgi:hypothetical protein